MPTVSSSWQIARLQMRVKYLSEQLERMLPHQPVEKNSPQGGGSSSE